MYFLLFISFAVCEMDKIVSLDGIQWWQEENSVERRRIHPPHRSHCTILALGIVHLSMSVTCVMRSARGEEVIPDHTFAPARKVIPVPFSVSSNFHYFVFMTFIHLCIGALG